VGNVNGRWHVAAVFVLLVAFMAMIGLYVQAQETQTIPSAGLPSPGVLFLEHNLIANGTVINGTVPFRTANFPSYWFNENTLQLNGNIDFPLNNSLTVIYGDALTLRGNFGAGTGNKLFGVYSLPARVDHSIIYYVDRTGTVGLYVNNRTVMLRPGQMYNYTRNETVRERNGTVKIAYEHIYTNHGLIPRSGIQTRMIV
jgi:hypothetical protein